MLPWLLSLPSFTTEQELREDLGAVKVISTKTEPGKKGFPRPTDLSPNSLAWHIRLVCDHWFPSSTYILCFMHIRSQFVPPVYHVHFTTPCICMDSSLCLVCPLFSFPASKFLLTSQSPTSNTKPFL